MVQIFLIAWGGVCIKVKVLGGIKSKIKANLTVDDWGFLTIHKENDPNNLLLRISLQESDDEPGPRGGRVEWSDEEEVELEAGGKAMTIRMLNRHGHKINLYERQRHVWLSDNLQEKRLIPR